MSQLRLILLCKRDLYIKSHNSHFRFVCYVSNRLIQFHKRDLYIISNTSPNSSQICISYFGGVSDQAANEDAEIAEADWDDKTCAQTNLVNLNNNIQDKQIDGYSEIWEIYLTKLNKRTSHKWLLKFGSWIASLFSYFYTGMWEWVVTVMLATCEASLAWRHFLIQKASAGSN